MLDQETGSCSSEFSSDAFHWDECLCPSMASARRSNRKRSFSKNYDVDMARMLSGKQDGTAELQEEFSGSWPLVKEEDSGNSLLPAGPSDLPASLYEPDSFGQFLSDHNITTASGLGAGHFSAEGLIRVPSTFDDILQSNPLEQDFFGESGDLFHLDTDNEFYNSYHTFIPETSEASSPCSGAATSDAAAVVLQPNRKSVLVAKVLTKSDAHAKRIILPRVAVEANLAVLLDEPSFAMSAKDAIGKDWKFVVKSWSNGHNPKPVYVMEQVADYLRHYKLGVGDAVGILITAQGVLIEHNSTEVKAAAERPTYCDFSREELASILFSGHTTSEQQSTVVQPCSKAAWKDSSAQTFSSTVSSSDATLTHMGGVLLCLRTCGCSRPAGHQGWCSGHKGFKRRRTSETK